MVKLRDDLVGVVYLNGRAYSAGDEVPDDVRVGGHLTEDGKDYGHLTPEPPRAVVEGSQIPLTEVEAAAAEAIGLDLAGHEPEWLRGAVAGHQLAADALSGEPLTADEIAAAEALGLPTDVHTERIRGAIEGHQHGVADTLANAAKGTGFDPADAPNADAVHEYVAAHPDETAAILALEAAGKARKGILGEYLG